MAQLRRYELTDAEWSIIDPLLPRKSRGVARVDDRRVLNGIFWRLRSGSPWADVPERYGPYTTCYNRFVRWRKAGIWDKLLASCFRSLQRQDPDDRQLGRACASARGQWRKKSGRSRCMGRSRGGLTTKIHAVVDAHGLPILLKLTEGQAHDGRTGEDMLGLLVPIASCWRIAATTVTRCERRSRNRRACQHPAPRPSHRSARLQPARLQAPQSRRAVLQQLKHFRAIATRFDKHDANFLASVKLAAIRIWMRFNESVT